MALNVTTAVFGENCNTATASPSLAQWDTEQVLQISGIELPDSYKVEFSTVYTRNAIPAIGDASGVAIPNVLLQRSAPITAYVVLYGENGGRNREYWITIHITPGQPPETITPDPEQEDVIDQAIAALNNGVARTEAAATSAEGSASDAADHAADAEAWAVGQRSGEDVDDQDPTYHNNSKYYAGMAEAAAEEAGQHEASWETWVQRAETAAGNAESSATAAGQSKTAAESAAQAAAQKATEAGNSAAAASSSAASARETVDGAIGAINTARDGALTQIGSAGSNATAAVNQAGTTQAERVTAEGNTQVNRVQAKGDEVIDSIPQDYSALTAEVDDLTRQLSDETTGLDTKAPVILETASGAIASFSDGADSMPVKKLVAQIEPVQDLHGYDNPWPAGGGKNKWDEEWEVGGISSVNGQNIQQNNIRSKNYIPVTAGSEYYVYITTDTNKKAYLFYYDSEKSYIGNSGAYVYGAVTIPSGVEFIRFQCNANYGYAGYGNDIAINYPATVTTYSHYSNICPISGHTGAEIEQTGKNLLNNVDPVYLNAYFNIATVSAQNDNNRILVVPCAPNTEYAFTWNRVAISGTQTARIVSFESLPTYGTTGTMKAASVNESASATFTTGANDKYVGIYLGDIRTTDVPASLTASQLEIGSATDYTPYTGNQISVTFPSEAGTVYGGTADPVNGELTDSMWRVSGVSFGSNTPSTAQNWISGYMMKTATTRPVVKEDAKIVCSVASVVSWGRISGEAELDKVYCWQAPASFGIAGPKSIVGETIADLNAWFVAQNVDFICEVENPIEYSLTQQEMTTLYGTNNLWASTGDVEVTYPADTKLYIDSKITQAIANALNS